LHLGLAPRGAVAASSSAAPPNEWLKLTGRLRKLAALALVAIGPQLNLGVRPHSPDFGRSNLVTAFIRATEVEPEQSWLLLAWCAAHGGTEIFVRQMSLVGEAEPNLDRANALLAPFQLPTAVRPRTVVYSGEPEMQPTELWALTPASIEVLRALLPDGLLAPPSYDEGGWLEEPTVYRDGSVLLGVVSHEGYAILDVSERERAELSASGVPSHPSAAGL
jgi:hypothetical protein